MIKTFLNHRSAIWCSRTFWATWSRPKFFPQNPLNPHMRYGTPFRRYNSCHASDTTVSILSWRSIRGIIDKWTQVSVLRGLTTHKGRIRNASSRWCWIESVNRNLIWIRRVFWQIHRLFVESTHRSYTWQATYTCITHSRSLSDVPPRSHNTLVSNWITLHWYSPNDKRLTHMSCNSSLLIKFPLMKTLITLR